MGRGMPPKSDEIMHLETEKDSEGPGGSTLHQFILRPSEKRTADNAGEKPPRTI